MNAVEAIRTRRSHRKFTDRKLETETIKELIDIGICAPSAKNMQPWIFVIVEGKDKIREISDRSKAYVLERFDQHPESHTYENWFRDPKFNFFYNAENLLIIYGDKNSKWYKEDCSCVAQNIMTAANEMGIGTCWVGLCNPYLDSDEGRRFLGVDENYGVVAPLILGYKREELKLPKRKEPKIIIK